MTATSTETVVRTEASDDALITTSRDNLILSWNSGADQLTGYRAHEVIGKNISFLFPTRHREIDALNARDANLGVAVRNSVVKALRKDGGRISLIYSVTPIGDREGNVIGLLRICKDISAFKSARVALEQVRDQMRMMDRVDDPILAAMGGRVGAGDFSGGASPRDPLAAENRRSRDEFLRIISEECRALGSVLQEINNLLRSR